METTLNHCFPEFMMIFSNDLLCPNQMVEEDLSSLLTTQIAFSLQDTFTQ